MYFLILFFLLDPKLNKPHNSGDYKQKPTIKGPKLNLENQSVESKLERGDINDLGSSKRFKKIRKATDDYIPMKEPQTITSAMKLIEEAQKVNNRASIELAGSLSRMSQRNDNQRSSYEGSPVNSTTYASNQSQKYSTNNFTQYNNYKEEVGGTKETFQGHTIFSVYNPPEKKNSHQEGKNIRYDSKEDESVDIAPEKLKTVTMITDPDERPIKPCSDTPSFGMNDHKVNSSKNILAECESPLICQNFSTEVDKNGGEKVMKKQKSQSSLTKKKPKANKNPKTKQFLKKRSKMTYDPMKAISEENRILNNERSVSNSWRYKNIQARTDSGLRDCISPHQRSEFRKSQESNSQIMSEKSPKNIIVARVSQNFTWEVNNSRYLNQTKIPSISKPKDSKGGKGGVHSRQNPANLPKDSR